MKFLFLIFLLFAQAAFANDGYSAIGAGGLVFKKTDKIAMQSEVLTISQSKVDVKYQFTYEGSDSDTEDSVTAVIAFPLPEITCGYWGNNKGIDDFVALVDGKPVALKKEIKAFNRTDTGVGETKDITAKVRAAHLPLDCREVWKNKKLFKRAQKAKLADNWTDPEDVRYVTRITYYWTQKFPRNKVVKIEHTYTHILGAESTELA